MGLHSASSMPLPAEPSSADRELALVCSSVNLVAAGAARRVTHVGLRYGADIFGSAQAVARRHGVIVRVRWYPDRRDCDMTVEPIG